MNNITLCIAGEKHEVLFDGSNVFDPFFPKEPIVSIKASCGMIITQEILIEICKRKLTKIE